MRNFCHGRSNAVSPAVLLISDKAPGAAAIPADLPETQQAPGNQAPYTQLFI